MSSHNVTAGTPTAFPKLPSQDVLPFPPVPSASIAGRTMQESVYKRRVEPRRLPADAPNILIVLIDDAGPGLPSTFGGEVQTPALDRISKEGISLQPIPHHGHVLPDSSVPPDRAEPPSCWGRTDRRSLPTTGTATPGSFPRAAATAAEVLRHYGYTTGAWGKWHNTPAEQTTAAGPFDCWPTGYGFDYFYGFLSGEASQYEPNLVRNTTHVAPPRTPEQGYHLSEDLADDAIGWLRRQKALQPDKPFYMYWASGAIHGPHHIMKEWADKYKGKFDDGWDKYRERVCARAKQKGWIPQDAQLTPRDPTMPSWDSIPEDEKPFQRRLMEVAAGFTEHVDTQIGRLVDELDRLGYGENTLIFYIWGDNGSSAEGQNGTIAEFLAQNAIPPTVAMHIQTLEALGGLDVLGSPKVDNHVPRRMGLGRQHAVQRYEAYRIALWRHPQSDGGSVAGEDQAGRHTAAAIPSCERYRADDLRGRRHHAASGGEWDGPGFDRRGEPGVFLRRSACSRPPVDAVLRGDGQPRDLSRRLDGVGVRATRALDSRAAARHPRVDSGSGHVGALQPRRGLDAEQRSRGDDAGEARAAERALRDGGGAKQSAANWRRPVYSGAPSRDENCTAAHSSGRSRAISRECRSFVRRPSATSRTSSRSPPRCRPTPTVCSTSWDRVPVVSRALSRTVSSATSTTSSSSSARRFAPRRSSRLAR